jgi:transposase
MALPISDDLRARIIRFYENHDDYTQRELADEFGVCKSFIEKLLQRWRATGSWAALPHGGGKQRTLKAHAATLKQLVNAQPDVTLEELSARVTEQTALTVSPATLTRELQRLRLRRKKVQTSARTNQASRPTKAHGVSRPRR